MSALRACQYIRTHDARHEHSLHASLLNTHVSHTSAAHGPAAVASVRGVRFLDCWRWRGGGVPGASLDDNGVPLRSKLGSYARHSELTLSRAAAHITHAIACMHMAYVSSSTDECAALHRTHVVTVEARPVRHPTIFIYRDVLDVPRPPSVHHHLLELLSHTCSHNTIVTRHASW
jgi:hypothetical protein